MMYTYRALMHISDSVLHEMQVIGDIQGVSGKIMCLENTYICVRA